MASRHRTIEAAAEGPAQQVAHRTGVERRTRFLPAATCEVLPGIAWGSLDRSLTPAFWAWLAWQAEQDETALPRRLGRDFSEQVAASLLGAFGMPSEVGWAAFVRIRGLGLVRAGIESDDIAAALRSPLSVGLRLVRYRFAHQRARYLAQALSLLPSIDLERDPFLVRNALIALPGIGPKTASWIVRDWYGTDSVAILDVHVVRACVMLGIFPRGADPARDYFGLERRFIEFARAIGARPSVLDKVMWRTMKSVSPLLASVRPRHAASEMLFDDDILHAPAAPAARERRPVAGVGQV